MLRESFNKYAYLWKDDKEVVTKAFVNTKPAISDFDGEILKFDRVEKEIAEIVPNQSIGILHVSIEALKTSMITEAQEWRQKFGEILNRQVKSDMEQVVQYIESQAGKLSHKIGDLDDLRNAVDTLANIRETEVDIEL